jgi:hypothetical protein
VQITFSTCLPRNPVEARGDAVPGLPNHAISEKLVIDVSVVKAEMSTPSFSGVSKFAEAIALEEADGVSQSQIWSLRKLFKFISIYQLYSEFRQPSPTGLNGHCDESLTPRLYSRQHSRKRDVQSPNMLKSLEASYEIKLGNFVNLV